MKLNLEDVHYHNINEFSDDFDVKDVHDDLNICERCNTIVMWDTEMYWQGECEESYHYCMKDYEAVCDDCFNANQEGILLNTSSAATFLFTGVPAGSSTT